MRIIFSLVILVALALSFGACKSGSGAATFCDTVCLKDTIKFGNADHPLKPYIYITARNCNADSLIWSYEGAPSNRKIGFQYLFGDGIKLNKDYTRCFIGDTTAAWLLFNDCATGRGYQAKLYFDKSKGMSASNSGFNNFDKKFSVPDNMVAYSDRGNIFVEDVSTGKKAMMTFGQKIEIDYDNVHATVDSINVTPTNIWAKIKIGDEWVVKEKKITLE